MIDCQTILSSRLGLLSYALRKHCHKNAALRDANMIAKHKRETKLRTS